ncbi:MAG: hypothetical protein MJ248_05245 [Bacilli bacterium]|nr:hypothetical protein [Bacilli bacterium]
MIEVKCVKLNEEQNKFVNSLKGIEYTAFSIAIKTHGNKVYHQGYYCYGSLIKELVHVIDIAMQCETKEERIVALLHEVVAQNILSSEQISKVIKNKKVLRALKTLENDPMFKDNKYYEIIKKNDIARKVVILDLKYLCDKAGGPYFTGFLTDYAGYITKTKRFLEHKDNDSNP